MPEMIVISEHPKHGKYFKMLQAGLGKEEIKERMTKDGMNPALLDKDPNFMVPFGEITKEKLEKAQEEAMNTLANIRGVMRGNIANIVGESEAAAAAAY